MALPSGVSLDTHQASAQCFWLSLAPHSSLPMCLSARPAARPLNAEIFAKIMRFLKVFCHVIVRSAMLERYTICLHSQDGPLLHVWDVAKYDTDESLSLAISNSCTEMQPMCRVAE